MDLLIQWLPMLGTLLVAGVAAGILAGLFGVGGGIVMVPALDLAFESAGVPPSVALHLSVATSMATIVPTAVSSARAHAARGAIDSGIARQWAIPIGLGALFGALLATQLQGRVLAGIFATMALLVAVKMLLPLDRVVLRESVPAGVGGALLPAAIGSLSAMMGIGGGTLSVPSMTLCGVPVHKAVGTAALLGLLISVPAALGYLFAQSPGEIVPPYTVGYVSLPGFAFLSPATWLAAPLGAAIAHRLDRRALSAGFGLFLLVVALRMLYRVFS
jgi:uncharacterized membrane protein YfcA